MLVGKGREERRGKVKRRKQERKGKKRKQCRETRGKGEEIKVEKEYRRR
jgi:hypothetical protein